MGRHCFPGDCARAFLHKVLEIVVPFTFSPVHSPLTNRRLAKSLNMLSQGVCFVSGNPVLRGRSVHALLRMLKRITQTLRTERVFDARATDGESKDIPSASSGVSIALNSSELLRKQSSKAQIRLERKKERW